MTTVVFKGNVIATDSLSTPIKQNVKKLFKISDTAYLSGTGDYSIVQTVARALQNDNRPIEQFIETVLLGKFVLEDYSLPNIKDTNVLLFYRGEYKILHYICVMDNWTSIESDGVKFWAWGSGAEFAMGALALGASAQEAVKVACKYDMQTGGPVQWVEL